MYIRLSDFLLCIDKSRVVYIYNIVYSIECIHTIKDNIGFTYVSKDRASEIHGREVERDSYALVQLAPEHHLHSPFHYYPLSDPIITIYIERKRERERGKYKCIESALHIRTRK